MKIEAHLDRLRKSQPGCHLAAYGDLSAKLILRSSADRACPREDLDRLGDKAAMAASVLDQVALPDEYEPAHCGAAFAVFTLRDTQLCARAGQDGNDLICAVFQPAHDIEAGLIAVGKAAESICEAEN